jgi:septal ring factor EnvC (AmiA/AmiB activator)
LAIEPTPDRTIDEMLADLNEFTDNFQQDRDDLADLRKRIAKTRKGINKHTSSTKNLKKTIMALEESSKEFSRFDTKNPKEWKNRAPTGNTKMMLPRAAAPKSRALVVKK